MKKILYSSVIAMLFTAFTLVSCEDVPSPYETPTDPSSSTDTEEDGYYLNETFTSSFGDFTVYTVTGTSWVISYSTATGTGYDSSTGLTTASESYLISPAVDLSAAESVYLSFDYIYRYSGRTGAEDLVLITSNYTGDPTTTEWTDITGTLTEGSDWSTFYSYSANIPSDFIGQSNVVVALYYACESSSATWEVKNLIMADGTAPDSDSDDSSSTTNTSSADNPYTVAEAIELISAMSSSDTLEGIYVKGIVSEIDEISTSYGNGTYYISDDGSTTNQLLIYRGYYLNNEKFTSATDLQVGDEVVVYGTFVNYYGNTPEGSSGATYVYSINGSTSDTGTSDSDTEGDGSLDNPYSVSTAISIISAMSSSDTLEDIYVKGIVSSITEISTSYGNGTYYISDDGSTDNQLLIYRGYYLNNESFTSENDLQVGDEIIVYGTFVNYYGNTPEGSSGKTYVYSINGSSSDSGDDSSDDSGSAGGVSISGTTVTLTNGDATAGTTTATIDLSSLGLENAEEVSGPYEFSDGATLTVEQGTGSTSPKYYSATNGFRIYANNTITFSASSTIAKIEMECDSYNSTDYVGNDTATVEFSGTTATYCNTYSGTGGGVQLRVKTITITYAN